MHLLAFKRKVSEACKNAIAAEPRITQSDTIVRDGDYGITLARGARAVISFLESPQLSSDALTMLVNLAGVIEDNMDGTYGAIYSIFFAGMASAVRAMPLSEAMDSGA